MSDFLGMPLGGGGGAAYPETVSLYAPASSSSAVRLRPATLDDAAILAEWDREPHVIACSTDDPDADVAFGGIQWREELQAQSDVSFYRIAEVAQDGLWRPIGVMQVIDPHLEPEHYWGEIEPNLRALDIWIGPKDTLGRGWGTQMMTQAIDACFAAPEVTAIVIDPLNSNTDAHRFYHRLGFEVVGRRMFDADDSLVHRLERKDWLQADNLVIPAGAKRRAGTADFASAPGPAREPGQTPRAPDFADPAPGSTLAARPGGVTQSGSRPGAPPRSGRDDKS